MLRDTAKHIVNGTKKTAKKACAAARAEPHTQHTAHGRPIVMWLAGYKFTISVEDWMRGH